MAETSSEEDPAKKLSRRYRLIVGGVVGASPVFALYLIGMAQEEFGLTLFAGLGGCLSGYFLAGGFGRGDMRGWIIALVTYLGCTIAGGAFGGLFVGLVNTGPGGMPGGPLGGLLAGAFMAPMLLMMSGVGSVLVWLASLTIIQLIAIRFRRYAPIVAPDIAKRFE